MTRDHAPVGSAAASGRRLARRRIATWLYPRSPAGRRCCSAGRSAGWSSPIWAPCSSCCSTRSGSKDAFTGKVEPFAWSLDAFQSIADNEVYRTIAIRTVGMAVLVTVTDALLAFPIAYYMARIASPTDARHARRRGADAAVGRAIWSRSTRGGIILQGNGFLEWVLEPFGIDGPGPRRARQRLARAQLPVAAVHDPARSTPAWSGSRTRSSRRRPTWAAAPRRPSGESSCRSCSRRSSQARSSRSR